MLSVSHLICKRNPFQKACATLNREMICPLTLSYCMVLSWSEECLLYFPSVGICAFTHDSNNMRRKVFNIKKRSLPSFHFVVSFSYRHSDFPWRRRVEIAIDVAAGMDYLHSVKYVNFTGCIFHGMSHFWPFRKIVVYLYCIWKWVFKFLFSFFGLKFDNCISVDFYVATPLT